MDATVTERAACFIAACMSGPPNRRRSGLPHWALPPLTGRCAVSEPRPRQASPRGRPEEEPTAAWGTLVGVRLVVGRGR